MRFIKMHGIGNDYVYINGFEQPVSDPVALAQTISDRHFGVGGDGLILVLPPEPGIEAHVRMRMFNADGSESEMCGNGIRCVAKLAYDHQVTPRIREARPMLVQTGNGVLSIDYCIGDDGKLANATVDMGEPILTPADVPVDPSKLTPTDEPHTFGLTLAGEVATRVPAITATMVSMGNPHAVRFIEGDAPLVDATLGPAAETHEAFPNRINFHNVRVDAPTTVTVWHWERGSGPTLACGTGACAVCVAGVLTGRTQRTITAHLPGGDLTLEWRESDNHVYMTGPATEVFTGEWAG